MELDRMNSVSDRAERRVWRRAKRPGPIARLRTRPIRSRLLLGYKSLGWFSIAPVIVLVPAKATIRRWGDVGSAKAEKQRSVIEDVWQW